MAAVSYTLLIDEAPAEADLLGAVQQIEVEDHAEMADIVRLRLAIGVDDGCRSWTILDAGVFKRLTKVKVLVTIGSRSPICLVESRVIETSADFANRPGASSLTVVAIDSTALMHLEQKVREWPNVADSTIASTIFGEHGFATDVETTQPSRQEDDVVMIQRGSDIRFLKELAARNGFECYVEPEPRTGQLIGHFHPPRLESPPQGVLSVNSGEATNVNSLGARYEMLRPTTARAIGLDIATQADQPATAQGLKLRGLGRRPSIDEDRPRVVLLSDMGLADAGEIQTQAQATVDRSAWAITAEGDLNTVAYGGILRAKRTVMVRGAGPQFSGTYYVNSVQHSFAGDGYTQRFSLVRNALGLTGQDSFTEDTAAAS